MVLRPCFTVARGFRFTKKKLKPEILPLVEKGTLEGVIFDWLKSENDEVALRYDDVYDYQETCPVDFRTHIDDDNKETYFLLFKDQSLGLDEFDKKPIIDFTNMADCYRKIKGDKEIAALRRLGVAIYLSRIVYEYLVGKAPDMPSWFAIYERL